MIGCIKNFHKSCPHDPYIKKHRKNHDNDDVPHVLIDFKSFHEKPNKLHDDDQNKQNKHL